MSNATTVLGVQLSSKVAESRAGLDGGDLISCRVGRVVHAVQLNDQVAVLPAEAERGVAVSSRLGRHLDAELLAAYHRFLDLLNGSGHRNGDGCVRHADVEGGNIAVPVRRALDVDGHAGGCETRFDVGTGDYGRCLRQRGQKPGDGNEGGDGGAHGGQWYQCSVLMMA